MQNQTEIVGVEECPSLWALEDYDILILPSITVSFYESRKITSIHEERHLVLLNLLKNKNSRIIFVMSTPLEADTIKYRLDVYKKAYHDPTAEERLILLSADDDTDRHLTSKILEKPALIEKIRSHIRNPDKAIMVSYICTDEDLKLRNACGINKWFGTSLQQWGTKSGSRQTFKESGVPIAPGIMETVFTMHEIEQAVLQLTHGSATKRAIVKTDDGSGGYGNIVLDFSAIQNITAGDVTAAIQNSVCQIGCSFKDFVEFVEQSGVVVEVMMDAGKGMLQTTPSVQLYIHDGNKVDIFSSHEQMVDGCIYLGCRFPANGQYAKTIIDYSEKIGKNLASKGVRGFLGIDYLVNQKEGDTWDIYALEINLRLCATTFSYFLLKTVAREEDIGKKHYLMLDELKVDAHIEDFRALNRAMAEKGMAYDSVTERGVLLATCGRIAHHHEASVLVVGNSRREVDTQLDAFLREFASQERKHFSYTRTSTPILPTQLAVGGETKFEKERERSEVKLNEQGVAV